MTENKQKEAGNGPFLKKSMLEISSMNEMKMETTKLYEINWK